MFPTDLSLYLSVVPASDVPKRALNRLGEIRASRRRPLIAMVTAEALAGYEGFAATHGVTVTGCVEAVGLALAESLDRPDSPAPVLIERARACDRQRREWRHEEKR